MGTRSGDRLGNFFLPRGFLARQRQSVNKILFRVGSRAPGVSRADGDSGAESGGNSGILAESGGGEHAALLGHPCPGLPRPALRQSHDTPLRASPPAEDPAPQDRVGEPRELARLAGSRGAARAGIRRGGTPRLSRVRAPLLRLRPRGLHDVPHGIRRGILLQGPRRLPVL